MTAIMEDSREYLPSTILEYKSPNLCPVTSNLSQQGKHDSIVTNKRHSDVSINELMIPNSPMMLA